MNCRRLCGGRCFRQKRLGGSANSARRSDIPSAINGARCCCRVRLWGSRTAGTGLEMGGGGGETNTVNVRLNKSSTEQHVRHARGLRRRRCCCWWWCCCSRCLLPWRRCRRSSRPLLRPWRGLLAQRCCFICCTLVVLLPGRPVTCIGTGSVVHITTSAVETLSFVTTSSATKGASECRYALQSCSVAHDPPHRKTWP